MQYSHINEIELKKVDDMLSEFTARSLSPDAGKSSINLDIKCQRPYIRLPQAENISELPIHGTDRGFSPVGEIFFRSP